MLAVEGNVVLESAGVRLRLEGSGATLIARFDGMRSLAMLRRTGDAASLARGLVPLLVRFGVTVDVLVGSLRIARAGAGVESNGLGRALGLDHVRIGR